MAATAVGITTLPVTAAVGIAVGTGVVAHCIVAENKESIEYHWDKYKQMYVDGWSLGGSFLKSLAWPIEKLVEMLVSYQVWGDAWAAWKRELPNQKWGAIRRDPLVFDLNGDGVTTLSVDSGVFFDYDGNGMAELTGWISAGDALLGVDRNGKVEPGLAF